MFKLYQLSYMKRRQSFSKIAIGFLASFGISVVSTCKLIADHFSSYSWPSYPKENALRRHLRSKPHYLTTEEINALTFIECRELHDKQHRETGGRPPSSSRLWMNKTYKKPVEKKPAVPITDVEIRPPY